jgi:hypothetical protein
MTRLTFISSTTVVCCIAAVIITIVRGSPSLAFTASTYGPMKQRSIVATAGSTVQQAHSNPQDPSKDGLLRRYLPAKSRSNLSSPQYITSTAMAVLTILLSLPLQPSYAGLLEEYGAGLTVNPPTTKPETTVAAPTKPSNGGAVQIDPTLRGCKYSVAFTF